MRLSAHDKLLCYEDDNMRLSAHDKLQCYQDDNTRLSAHDKLLYVIDVTRSQIYLFIHVLFVIDHDN